MEHHPGYSTRKVRNSGNVAAGTGTKLICLWRYALMRVMFKKAPWDNQIIVNWLNFLMSLNVRGEDHTKVTMVATKMMPGDTPRQPMRMVMYHSTLISSPAPGPL